jgi:hypothetical protein
METTMDFASLASRLQRLPQELCDLILLEVFTPDDQTVEIDTHEIKPNHRPPKFLSINSLTRDIYAKAYYGGHDSSFILHVPQGFDTSLAMQWLKSLTPAHLSMMRRLMFIYRDPIKGDPKIFGRRARQSLRRHLEQSLKKRLTNNGIEIADQQIGVELRAYDRRGKEIAHKPKVLSTLC